MDMLVVRGGRPLRGEIEVSGAKNAALPIMAAAIAAQGPLTLHRVPNLVDVRTQSEVLFHLGVSIEPTGPGSLRLETVDEAPCVAPYDLVRTMRASVCVLGPLLARRGRATVSLPGGCNIGHRPIDLHLRGLSALGADIRIENGYVVAEARQLRGARIDLAGPSGSTVTGTCNVMTAAALARGTTVIQHAAREPEVEDLAVCLNRLGAKIEGAGTSTLVIDGVAELGAGEHTIVPDRIEAATLLCAALITRGSVRVTGIRSEHLMAVVDALLMMGADLQVDREAITVAAGGRLHPAEILTRPYPGVPTDVQAQLTAVLTQAEGTSCITETVFPDRFMHVSELMRLGASIRRAGAAAIVHGPTPLSGASVMASDLRASAALVVAALAAEGQTVIRRIYHLDRGYERLEQRLRQLGAAVERRVDAPEGLSQPGLPAEAAEHLRGPHFDRPEEGLVTKTSRGRERAD